MRFMTSNTTALFTLSLLMLALAPAPVFAADDEPIAYIGHGGFFDSTGREIALTPDFVARAQAYYRDKLVSALSAAKKKEFATFEARLKTEVRAEGQAKLVVDQRALDWLLANSPPLNDGGRTRGKINALKRALTVNLTDRATPLPDKALEAFKLDPAVESKLKLPQFTPGGVHVLSATVNSGQAYINECIAQGVPIPPPIGQLDPAGLAGWKSQGFIPIAKQFIGQNAGPSPAEIRTFQVLAPSPQEGMCIALPRYKAGTNKTMVGLDGVICLGKNTSKVCIWDNQMNGFGFDFVSGTKIPIGVPNLAINPAGQYQAGGFELEGGTGGVCTDCHAGQNPYIVHPKAVLEDGNGNPTSVTMGDLNQAPLNLPTFSAARYDPLVPADWPQNQLSHSPALVPDVCNGCHFTGGEGGAFPHLSKELNGAYCNTILGQAITRTMPPSSPGSQAANPDVITFKNWCNTFASAGPSDRGDPHLTTTNGVNYDFQAAGEFTALRNSATKFELQTRQTPVSTTFTPPANAYTGLATCVSLNTAAALRVGKHRVTYQGLGSPREPQRVQLRIDGSVVTLPAGGINLGGGNVIAKAGAGTGIDVKAADGTHVLISQNFWSSQGYWYLNVEVLNTPAREGTMGTILPGNWLPLAPTGASFGPAPASLADRYVLLNKKFADAWRVTTSTSLFDYSPGTSTATFTDVDWPPMSGGPCKAVVGPGKPPPQPMEPAVAQRLCREIKDKAAFAGCVLDLTATGEKTMLQAYLLSLKLRAAAGP